jgi:GntR family transcriptional regulator
MGNPRAAKYLRVAEDLRSTCAALPEGTQLPPEKELARQFQVSLMTVRRALEFLDEEGFVNRVGGRGTFVQRRVIAKGGSLTSFSEDMRMRGLEPSARLMGIEVITAPEEVMRDLRLGSTEKVVVLERLRFADGEPMCLEVVHLPARFAHIVEASNLDGSLHELLAANGVLLATGTRRTRAVAIGERAAGLLRLHVGAPALEIVQVFFDPRGRPVQRAKSLYRGDRYEAFSKVRRRGIFADGVDAA